MVTGIWAKAGLVTLLACGLSACEGGLGFGKKPDPAPGETSVLPPDGAPILGDATAEGADPDQGRAADLPRGEIEAPNLFNQTDKALWDGRPSLGGTWIAHPDVTDPQRVIIRNTENGKSTVAALFRRERDNPGPAFQMSGDAATKLGLLAGQPTVVTVVALKRPEAPKAAPVAAEPAETPSATEPAETPSATEPAETPSTTTPETAGETPSDDSPEGIAAAATAAIGVTAAAGAEGVEGAVAGGANPATEVAAVPVKPGKPLAKAFVEIGYFQQETNATATIEQITAAGLAPQLVASNIKGQPVWRLIVGPSMTKEELSATIQKLKAMGFSTAKAVKG